MSSVHITRITIHVMSAHQASTRQQDQQPARFARLERILCIGALRRALSAHLASMRCTLDPRNHVLTATQANTRHEQELPTAPTAKLESFLHRLVLLRNLRASPVTELLLDRIRAKPGFTVVTEFIISHPLVERRHLRTAHPHFF